MQCHVCKKMIADGIKFCPYCGAAVNSQILPPTDQNQSESSGKSKGNLHINMGDSSSNNQNTSNTGKSNLSININSNNNPNNNSSNSSFNNSNNGISKPDNSFNNSNAGFNSNSDNSAISKNNLSAASQGYPQNGLPKQQVPMLEKKEYLPVPVMQQKGKAKKMKAPKTKAPKDGSGGNKAPLVALIMIISILILALSLGILVLLQSRKISVAIDDTCLGYEDSLEYYYVPTDFTGLTGTLTGSDILIGSALYTIEDMYGTVVSSGELEVDENGRWRIKKPGMMLGKNTLTITVKDRLGREHVDTIEFTNDDDTYLQYLELDSEDEDEDGLIGYLEATLGTDPTNPDTDEDGLLDGDEYVLIGTDPAMYDSMDDGICDADRDADDDGVPNLKEIEAGTNPVVYDTDDDGLSDGEEEEYSTDPLNPDSDGDGAGDGWEVEHGYDPLTAESDFKAEEECPADDSGVSMAVSITCDTPEDLTITPTYIDSLLEEDMEGYIGRSYTMEYDGDFDDAEIEMTFDPGSVSDTSQVTICEYDEETQLLTDLDTTVSGDTATARSSHATTYVLIDRSQVPEVDQSDIMTQEEIDAIVEQMAFVIDYSQSMDDNDPQYTRIDIVNNYLDNMRPGHDMASVVKFAGYATTLVPMSSDIESCKNAVSGITNNSGDSCDDEAGTNGSDGLRHALDEFAEGGEQSKSIIFLTDGEDTETTYEYSDLIAEAVQKNVKIYTIGLGEADETLLTEIASGTGGQYYHVSEVEASGSISLEDAFGDISSIENYDADDNGDGLKDYYVRLICDGKLKTGTGVNIFEGYTYEEIQDKGSDFDNDGLDNGEEIEVTELDGFLYLKIYSNPTKRDTDGDGHDDRTETFDDSLDPMCWDVGDRDLAIFALLSYSSGDAFRGGFYNENVLSDSDKEEIQDRFYNYGSIFTGGVDESIARNWSIVDYVENRSAVGTVFNADDDYFSMTVYKCRNNVVLAYRGTNSTLDWIDNFIGYGLTGAHGQEGYAKYYARKVAERYPKCKIYITGHSLGGYLAQIGAAEMIQATSVDPERVAYFNGIGINFTDLTGTLSNLASLGILPVKITNDAINHTNKVLHMDEIDALKNYYTGNSDGVVDDSDNLISYRIKGDVVSALGSHYGEIIVIDPPDDYAEVAKGKADGDTEFVSSVLMALLTGSTGNVELAACWIDYKDKYDFDNVMEYFNFTHAGPPFLYSTELNQGERHGH